jgi:hypothetical protein
MTQGAWTSWYCCRTGVGGWQDQAVARGVSKRRPPSIARGKLIAGLPLRLNGSVKVPLPAHSCLISSWPSSSRPTAVPVVGSASAIARRAIRL